MHLVQCSLVSIQLTMALVIEAVRSHIVAKLSKNEAFIPGPLSFSEEELVGLSAVYKQLHSDLRAKGINCEDQLVQGRFLLVISGAKYKDLHFS